MTTWTADPITFTIFCSGNSYTTSETGDGLIEFILEKARENGFSNFDVLIDGVSKTQSDIRSLRTSCTIDIVKKLEAAS